MFNKFDFSKAKVRNGLYEENKVPLFYLITNPSKAAVINNKKTEYYLNNNSSKIQTTASHNIDRKMKEILTQCKSYNNKLVNLKFQINPNLQLT